LLAAGIGLTAIALLNGWTSAAEPAARYPYQIAPRAVVELLDGVKDSSDKRISFAADEARLFADVQNGQMHEFSFGEAAVLASGATDAAKRKEYLAQLDTLEAGARKATGDAKTTLEKGEQLLKFIHAGPMAHGYEAQQTDLSKILDTGRFNCVSSAVLYDVLARRLGLEVRAVEIPGHVFAVVYDGPKSVDVETTNALGFNPSDETREKIKLPDGGEYVAERHHGERREVNEAGLVALIYYNHGVSLAADKHFHEAVVANASALALDPTNPSAAKNLMANLNNWSLDLAGASRYEQAITVLAVSLKLDPKDGSLLNNQRAIWNDYANSLAKSDRYDRALEIVRRAAQAIPGFDLAAEEARLFEQRGEESIQTGHWDTAIALADRGLAMVDSAARKELQDWRVGAFLRQSNAALQAGDFKRAALVLETGLKLEPTDGRLKNNVAYLAQQWGQSINAKDGFAAAVDVLVELRKRFPQIDEIKEVAANQVRQFVQTQTQQARYDEALAGIEHYGNLLGSRDEATGLVVYVYDARARKSMDSKDWAAAMGVYEQGLKKLPGNGHLANNLAYCQQQIK